MNNDIISHRSQSLADKAVRLMPGGVSSPVRALHAVHDRPLFIERGDGARVTDIDGQVLIDYIGSWGAAIVGHSHPQVIEAVSIAVRDGLSFGATSSREIELAEAVIERVPSVEQVRFVCSGTEAVMSAVRLARAATKRTIVVKFDGGYHGHGDALLASAGSGVATFGLSDSPGVTAGVARDTISLPYNDISRVEELFSEKGDKIACVVVEPVAGNMGVVPGTSDFLKALRSLTESSGALLIFDEVMTGFRVARGGAQELTGVQADLITMGKIIGGGLPVAAYAGSTRLMKYIAPAGPVYQAGTMAGNPVGMAAGLATLKLLDSQAYDRLESLGSQLEAGLRHALEQSGTHAAIQRVGSMLTVFFGVSAVRDFAQAQASSTQAFANCFRLMRKDGILLPPGAFESWFISLAHQPADIAHTVSAFSSHLGL